MDTDAEANEQKNVHAVYESIAGHFSSTRYKPWPVVDKFLRQLPAGSIGIDAGCGNGKYLTVNPNVFMVGSDYSSSLVKIANERGFGAVVADSLALPHRLDSFDFAISIAVIHHFSSQQRRVQALKECLVHLRPTSGKLLVFVWALEQKNSRRGWDSNSEQDVMVPWVKHDKQSDPSAGNTFMRYYHLFREGELEQCISMAGGEVIERGYDRDNWWCICRRPSH